ncbi:baseplate hub protein [Rodentibacter caecimuris]|uniref:baseplate hub protein n=1 Tax=Rodentibacter caecimuris TaxID=1796644 RepID=UPI0013A092F7|nr:hypothetical protein [Rodentibacter heylii]QIA76188.1 hypothetical protein FEE42_01875 [Rodentibacter heylii]
MELLRNGSFKQRKLRVTLLLGSPEQKFDNNGNNTVIIENMRVSAQLFVGGGNMAPTAQIVIYGLSQSIMDRVARVKWYTDAAKLNFVRLEALNNEVYSILFEGMISFATPNFAGAPNVSLTIKATTAAQHQILPVPPISKMGDVDVATLISQICQKMGMEFENNDVNVKISNPYLCETSLEQVKKICLAADIDLAIEANKVAIKNKGQGRKIKVPVISPTTGLIGYPMLDLSGIKFQCLFDPEIKFHGICEIRDSVITPANGQWVIYGLNHYLESETPNGKWFCQVSASRIGEIKVK